MIELDSHYVSRVISCIFTCEPAMNIWYQLNLLNPLYATVVILNVRSRWFALFVVGPCVSSLQAVFFCMPRHLKNGGRAYTVWGIHEAKYLGTRSLLLFLAPHQVEFLEYHDLYLMEFVQMKRRVRGKLSSFWWCKRYSAILSDSREHSENVFAVNLGYRDNVHDFGQKSFLAPIWRCLKWFPCWECVKNIFRKFL